MRYLELLAPAKNLECGIAAIDSGADAVYIGADRFGARQSAGNSITDIAALTEYAHKFGCKVFVTVNTIIYDNELDSTQDLINELGKIGVDAILVQDMGLLKLSLPKGVALHASTQTDNRTAEKVKWLSALGFERVVLARETSLDEICEIHKSAPDTELEAFVHGALCVSYSGVCYASEYCFGRSANRGACAQFCRLKFDLLDNEGSVIKEGLHFLSLKDMCRIESLEKLADAGVTSFKIEGRLKDINYVRNVTAAYSRKLNEIVSQRPKEYQRASLGAANITFTPNLKKTFNRGFTEYFLYGRKSNIASFYTPKAMGEYVGKVKEVRGNSFNVAGTANFANGDGLCFINSRNELEGFRINRAEGNRLFPLKIPKELKCGTALYRNNDQCFEKELNSSKEQRKIPVDITLQATEDNISITASVKDTDLKTSVCQDIKLEKAKSPQRDNILRQLAKLGNTIFKADKVSIEPEDFQWFIPNSLLSETRRSCMEQLEENIKAATDIHHTARSHENEPATKGSQNRYPMPYMYNIANHLAEKFYEEEGIKPVRPAFEIKKPQAPMIMQCKYCLRYETGQCKKLTDKANLLKDPLRLRLPDGKTFRLEFDCAHCMMNIYAEE